MNPEEQVIELFSMIANGGDVDFPNLYEESAAGYVSLGPGTLWLAEGLAQLGNGPASPGFLSVKESLNPGMAS
jgi:hypothetical protein